MSFQKDQTVTIKHDSDLDQEWKGKQATVLEVLKNDFVRIRPVGGTAPLAVQAFIVRADEIQ